MVKKKNDVIAEIITHLYEKNMSVEEVGCLLQEFCSKNLLCKKELYAILKIVPIPDDRKSKLQEQLKEILQK